MATINIRPTSGVYATYKRLTYQPWTAFAEFIDNSTQSYFYHRDELLSLKGYSNLRVDINYENNIDGNDMITITDSAFGMEWEDFQRAIVLDKIPPNTDGRNEFGMGLKTAACWFGRKWSIISTQLGSIYGYSITVDVDKLERDKDEEIEADVFETSPDDHYTIVKIEKLNKKLRAPRTIGKVKELLSNIYRQDIRNGDVLITYNGTELSYKIPAIYEEKITDGSIEKWQKDVNFSIVHEDKELEVRGFVAIRIPASLRDAGFTLLRRGRVIIGGPEQNYRPPELFGDPNSYAYQRLFGELHMDNWPVTQAKDDFDWHTDGLEEQFIEKLSNYSKPFRLKAEQIRVRQRIETNEVIKKTVDEFQKAGIIQEAFATPVNIEEIKTDIQASEENSEKNSSLSFEPSNTDEETITTDNGLIFDGPKNHETVFEYKGTPYLFNIEFETTSPLSPWMTVNNPCDNTYKIILNMKHPFFKPFIDNKEFSIVMTKFVLAMVIAEIESLKISINGHIEASMIRSNMNKILEALA